jgi:glycosyltransferase involved in cell wall biosynthesis
MRSFAGQPAVSVVIPVFNVEAVLLELTRNFGFQAALAAALTRAPGDAIVTLAADLQDSPELMPEMVAQ